MHEQTGKEQGITVSNSPVKLAYWGTIAGSAAQNTAFCPEMDRPAEGRGPARNLPAPRFPPGHFIYFNFSGIFLLIFYFSTANISFLYSAIRKIKTNQLHFSIPAV